MEWRTNEYSVGLLRDIRAKRNHSAFLGRQIHDEVEKKGRIGGKRVGLSLPNLYIVNWRSVTGDNDATDWLVMRPPHQLFTIGFNYLLYLNKCHGRVLEVYTYYYYRLRFTNTYLIRLFNSVDKNTNGDYLISA